MKSLIGAVLLSASTVFAQPVELAVSNDGEVWVGYVESFTRNKDGFYMMVGQRVKGRPENRAFVGVEVTTCVRGFGAIYMRMNPNEDWQILTNVTTESTQTVADNLAVALCTIGADQIKEPKSRSRT